MFWWDPPDWQHHFSHCQYLLEWDGHLSIWSLMICSCRIREEKDVKISLIPVQEALSVLTADFAMSEVPFGAQLSFCCPMTGWRLRGIVRLSKALSAWSHHHSPEGSQYGPLSCEVQSLKGKGRKEMSSSSYLLTFQNTILPHCWPVVPILLWNASLLCSRQQLSIFPKHHIFSYFSCYSMCLHTLSFG